MYTKPATDTFLFVNDRNSMLVIGNGIDWTAVFTGALQICNRMVRTSLCAFTAFLTL